MTLSNDAVSTAFRALARCSAEVRPAGPWRWHCLVQNAALRPLTASVEDGFLHLVARLEAQGGAAGDLERALQANGTLPGGVKFALSLATSVLHLCTDIALLDEARLSERVHWAMEGFHHGYDRLNGLDSDPGCAAAPGVDVAGSRLGELLRETAWSCTERSSREFAVELHQDSIQPARITASARGVALNVELVRCDTAAEAALRAMSIFLLTASSGLRLVRAYGTDADGVRAFGMQVGLASEPAPEELDHALAALSVAHQMCAREAKVLLDPAAARCYLAVRDFPLVEKTQYEQEK
jgi:hypothetical protein